MIETITKIKEKIEGVKIICGDCNVVMNRWQNPYSNDKEHIETKCPDCGMHIKHYINTFYCIDENDRSYLEVNWDLSLEEKKEFLKKELINWENRKKQKEEYDKIYEAFEKTEEENDVNNYKLIELSTKKDTLKEGEVKEVLHVTFKDVNTGTVINVKGAKETHPYKGLGKGDFEEYVTTEEDNITELTRKLISMESGKLKWSTMSIRVITKERLITIQNSILEKTNKKFCYSDLVDILLDKATKEHESSMNILDIDWKETLRPYKKPEYYHKRYIPDNIAGEIYHRFNNKCAKCGSIKNLEIDHIIPFSKGGSNNINNLQLLCQNCNRTKGNRI